MAIAGIIAEYNPFHNGHGYHLEQAKARTGADALVVVLSGDFVQRGEIAAADRHVRARWALLGGADLVLELPLPFALGNAQRFAQGAVSTLAATGLATHLCFGCETEDLPLLWRCSRIREEESPAARQEVRSRLSSGVCYPRACQEAYRAAGLEDGLAATLAKPNSILAIEYLRALTRLDSQMCPVPILRRNAQHHDAGIHGSIASASAVRAALYQNDQAAFSALPHWVAEELADAFIPHPESLGQLMLFALRGLSIQQLAALPEVAEGLENVLYRACRDASSYQELFAGLKSKRYTMARLKRICCAALLGLEEGMAGQLPYVRVLGVKEQARGLLGRLQQNCRLPFLVQGKDFDVLTGQARRIFDLEERAAGIMALICGRPYEQEARRRLVVV